MMNMMNMMNMMSNFSVKSLGRAGLCLTLLSLTTYSLLVPNLASAKTELHNDTKGIWRAEVIEITESGTRIITGTETETDFQTIRAQVLDGPEINTVINIEDDYLKLDVGEKFYFTHSIFIDDSEAYAVLHRDRSTELLFLVLIFCAAVIALSKWQGVRSLVALAGSFITIFWVLLPGVLAGWNPIVASGLVAAIILFGAIFFTHGINRESAVAYAGTMIAVGLTVMFAMFAVSLTSLTGFASEGSVALNFITRGGVDLTSLLLAAIIIGVLGVLDDIAVTQAAVVTELFSADKTQSRKTVFVKALRVGREHVGALVNTLVLAYTGAALPVLLYYYASASSISMSLSSELFATEIVRMIVGSVGLIVTVPIVTGLAVWYLKDYQPKHASQRSHHGHSH